jgi:hypothetical protein
MKDPFKITISILTSIILAISGWSLKWQVDMNARFEAERVRSVLTYDQMRKDHEEDKELVQKQIDKLSEQTQIDTDQTDSLRKHWRLHNWARSRINHLEHQNGDRPTDWPDLSD